MLYVLCPLRFNYRTVERASLSVNICYANREVARVSVTEGL